MDKNDRSFEIKQTIAIGLGWKIAENLCELEYIKSDDLMGVSSSIEFYIWQTLKKYDEFIVKDIDDKLKALKQELLNNG